MRFEDTERMHSTASGIAKNYHISKRNFSKISTDSEILEDNKELLESPQCSSKVKHIGAKNNVDKILQLPANVKKRSKRKLDDEKPGSSTHFTTQEYLDKKFTLQKLREEEKRLKIAVIYEKLRKEEPVFLEREILNQKIADYEKLLQEARSQYKMKNIMCVNLQLANALQRIVGKTTAASKPNGFSASQRKHIEGLLTKKKKLNQSISVKRKEIAEMDEDILKLKKTVLTNKQKKSKRMKAYGLNGTSTKAANFEELESLEENNEKVADRVHLLSGIIQSLIPHAGSRWQEDPDLLDMMEECQKVSKCCFDDLAEINALLTSVDSINL